MLKAPSHLRPELILYEADPRWRRDDLDLRWKINRIADEEFNMRSNFCTYCGKYCVTKYLSSVMECKRDEGKVYRLGGCADLCKDNKEEYNDINTINSINPINPINPIIPIRQINPLN